MKELNKVGVEEMLVVRTFEKNLRFEKKKLEDNSDFEENMFVGTFW